MSRLRRTYNAETRVYFVTANTHRRKKLFLNKELSRIVVETLFFLHKKHWIRLLAYVVMPDHIHVLFEIIGKKNVSEVMHSIKSYTTQQMYKSRQGRDADIPRQGRDALAMGNNKHIGGASLSRRRMKKIWQDSFYDRVVDTDQYLHHLIHYIHYNPVRASLVKDPKDWNWSSYHAYEEKGFT